MPDNANHRRKGKSEKKSVGLEPGDEIGEVVHHGGKYTRIASGTPSDQVERTELRVKS